LQQLDTILSRWIDGTGCNRPNWMESDGQLEVVPNFAEMCSVSSG
jgi:hypothetical protein